MTGDQVEVKGKVVAGTKTFESLVPGRRAVWCHLLVEEVDDVGHDETRRTIFDDIHTAEFMDPKKLSWRETALYRRDDGR